MARVVYQNAVYTGSIGGTTYSRNASGAIARQRVKPTNPNTPAQSQNRSRFGGSSGSWGSVDAAQRAAWNGFGKDSFVGHAGKKSGGVTGFQAYQSMFVTVANCLSIQRVITVTAPTAITLSHANFAYPLVPPQAALSGNIKTAAGAVLGVSIGGGCTLSSLTADVVVVLKLSQAISAAPVFTDPVSGEKVGFSVQISRPMSQSNAAVRASSAQLIGSCAPIDTVTGTFTSIEEISLKFAGPFDVGRFKTWFSAEDKIQLSVYMCSESGQQRLLGQVVVTAD